MTYPTILNRFLKKLNKSAGDSLTSDDFVLFLTELYEKTDDCYREIFESFDVDQDGKLNVDELNNFSEKWLSIVLNPVTALLIVDVQNDFISGTLSLKKCPAKQDAEATVAPINNILSKLKFDHVFYSLDWHPENHISFFENRRNFKLHESSPVSLEDAQLFDKVIFDGKPPIEQVLWPKHCVQNTWGSELHKDLIVDNNAVMIKKGVNPKIDSYSVFFDNQRTSMTDLVKHMKESKVTHIYICGIAYDWCVGFSALDALSLGLCTVLIDDCCRGVDEGGIEDMKKNIISKGGLVVQSSEVKQLLDGTVKKPEQGHFLSKYISKSNL